MKLKQFLQNLLCVALPLLSGLVTADEIPKASPESVGMSDERLALVTDLANRYVKSNYVPGVITLVNRGGKIVHQDVVGQRGLNDDRPLMADHLFRIYSMTKPITAVAAMMLYEQNKFHLSDPVEKYVPELANLKVMNESGELVDANSKITMHQLLTHTAGFSYGFDPTDPVDKLYQEADLWGAKDLTAFAEVLAKLPLRHQPGSRWHYSVAVDVTGLVVERISGKSFDSFLQDELFEPLDMYDTFFSVPENKLERFLPLQSWDYQNSQMQSVGENMQILGDVDSDDAMLSYTNVTLFSGGGGLVSTARDYMRFAEMLRNGGALGDARILSPKTLKYMARNHLDGLLGTGATGEDPLASRFQGFGFGLGFGTIEDTTKMRLIGSEGSFMWGGAAGTIFWVDPVEDLVVVGLIQLMASPWPFREDLRALTYPALIESYE